MAVEDKQLAPHQQRVVDEHAQLRDKLEKLDGFIAGPIYGDLPDPEKARLVRQSLIMELYEQVLSERIAAW